LSFLDGIHGQDVSELFWSHERTVSKRCDAIIEQQNPDSDLRSDKFRNVLILSIMQSPMGLRICSTISYESPISEPESR